MYLRIYEDFQKLACLCDLGREESY